MVSNNSSVSHPSNLPPAIRSETHEDEQLSRAKTRPIKQETLQNENVSVHIKPSDKPFHQDSVHVNSTVKEVQAQDLSKPCSQIKKEEVVHDNDPVIAAGTSGRGGGNKEATQARTDDNSELPPPAAAEQTGDARSANDAGTQTPVYKNTTQNITPEIARSPAAEVQRLKMRFVQNEDQDLRLYLRPEEYLEAVLLSTVRDFVPTPLVRDGVLHGKYAHLLGYAKGLEGAGQIATPQDVVLLAVANCFRPLGHQQEAEQDFSLTANILKQSHRYARNYLLLFLQVMLQHAPAAFLPRGESLLPILDGFTFVMQSYYEVLPYTPQAKVGILESASHCLHVWQVELENATIAMGALVWLARQPAYWGVLNRSQMLILVLCSLSTEPLLDKTMLEFVVEYALLNRQFLRAVDIFAPQNVVLDTFLSAFEYSAGMEITSLQYPQYMTSARLDEYAPKVLCATISILFRYCNEIPRESLVLGRFIAVLVEVLLKRDFGIHKQMLGMILLRLFERFPEEFDVDHEFISGIGRLCRDPLCKESAERITQIIQERSRELEGQRETVGLDQKRSV